MYMSLIDDLRQLGKVIPSSHLPSDGELKGVVGGILLFIEHGQEVFNEVKNDEEKLHNLLATGDPNKSPDVPNPEAQAASQSAQEQRIIELEQQVQNLLAVAQKSQGEVAQ